MLAAQSLRWQLRHARARDRAASTTGAGPGV